MAFSDYFELFYKEKREEKDDGFGGVEWVTGRGESFEAAVLFGNSKEAREMEAQGIKSIFHIFVLPDVRLNYGDTIVREYDGSRFRITDTVGDDKTPQKASIQYIKIRVEKLVRDG